MAVETLNSWLEDMAGALRFLMESVSVVCVVIGIVAFALLVTGSSVG